MLDTQSQIKRAVEVVCWLDGYTHGLIGDMSELFPASFSWRSDIGVEAITVGEITVWSYHDDDTDECMTTVFCVGRLWEHSKLVAAFLNAKP